APAEHAAVPRALAAAPTTRRILEAWIGVRGLRGDPMPGLCRRRLDRWLQERHSTPARRIDGPSQGPHRAVGPRLSALCSARPADGVPAGDAAVVGLLAEGDRSRRDGRADAARLDDGQREACVAPRGVAGPVGWRARVAITRNNTAAAVLDG